MSRTPHVLYVAWGFPPARGGGVYRALATSAAFAAAGAEVTVLTAEREAFERYTGVDAALEEHVDPRVRVRRIPFHWPAREPDPTAWSPLRRRAPRVWWRLRKVRDRIPFPEFGYGPWRRPLQDAARAIHAERPVDLVVATANPYVDFAAAAALHRDAGIRYVLDYRDAWSFDVFSGDRTRRRGSRVDRLERRLIDGATEVWFVNEPIRARYAAEHPSAAHRMRVVANGYDPGFAPAPRTHGPDPHRPLRFGYLGTATRQVPMTQFRAGWALARERCEELARATASIYGYAGHYATPPADSRTGDAPAGSEHDRSGVVLLGPVSKAAVAGVYEELDVLLLLLGSGRYVTSGKVYEYIASALPIVSVHDPGNAASEVLRDYPLWFPVEDLTPESIASALVSAAVAAREADEVTRRASARYAEGLTRAEQLRPPATALLANCSD